MLCNEVMRNSLIQGVLGKGVAPVSKPIANKTRRGRRGRGRMSRICLDSSIHRGEVRYFVLRLAGGLRERLGLLTIRYQSDLASL